jgi:hypothetical protein
MTELLEKAQALAKLHPIFTIHAPDVLITNKSVTISHRFSASGGLAFSPTTRIYGKTDGKEDAIKRLALYASLVESLSYWKASCSPKIIIEKSIPKAAFQWFEDLMLNGMMEYRYTNGLPSRFVPEVEWEEDSEIITLEEGKSAVPLVLVSGGKDSTVTLSLLHQNGPIKAFVLNQLPAADRVLAAFPDIEIVRGERSIDSTLLELNKSGYLNGHTPFSALLSVISTIAAILADAPVAIASNEASAEAPFAIYDGMNVNHQYSKSLQYEKYFGDLIKKTIPGSPPWFSFLRPLSEPQICLLLSKRKDLLSLISSCNRNQSIGSWCGSCPKCVSTWILLHPYVNTDELKKLFGKDVLEEGKKLMPALLGNCECRPLECVGTPEELDASLRSVVGEKEPLNNFLSQFATHLIPKRYEDILKHSLTEAQNA